MSPVERNTVVSDTAATGIAGLRRISWGAVIAGMVIAVAIQVVLGLFGTAVGLGTIDPMQRGGVPSATSLGTGAGLWWAASSIIALFAGGWTAGRLAGSPDKTDALLHGLLTWGVATIVTIYLVASMVGTIVRGGAAVVGKTAEVAASGVGAVAGQAADAARERLDDSNFSLDDSLDDLKAQAQKLLAQTGKPALQPQSVASQASSAADQLTTAASAAGSSGNPPVQDLDAVLKRIIASGKNTVDQADRDAVANVVAARTGLSKAEAEQRTDAWIQQYQQARAQFEQKKAEVEAKARKAADDAASASAKAALGAAVALVLGAIAAAIGGFIARRRLLVPYGAAGTVSTARRT